MKVFAFPLSKITLAFVAGLILSLYFPLALNYALTLTVTSFAIALVLNRWTKTSFGQIAFSIAVLLTTISTAFAVRSLNDDRHHSEHYIHLSHDNDSGIIFNLREKLRTTKSGQRYIVNIESINRQNATGKITVTIRNADSLPLKIGDRLIAYTKIITNRPPLNPGQFDYGKYLANKGIYGQIFIDPKTSKKIGTVDNMWSWADRYRTKVVQKLADEGFNEAELHVVAALILGQQQEISPEIIKNYQFAGAVHILSVSGLHIGMIALMLGFLLNQLPNTPGSRLIKAITIIAVLWIFGLIAGFSPSVVRSVTMFSFLTVGNYLRRSTNIYHTLLVSALVILFVEPSFLVDVGFQLSYAALFFILWMQPMFDSMWSPQNRLVKYFWDILTVSFAAQIGTLPLSIFYFHQFPGLFFITNLLIIPWLSIIMSIGVAVIILAAFGTAIPFLLWLLEWSIWLLNQIIAWIASFESFIFQDIPLEIGSMLLLYTLIVSLALFCTEKKCYNLAISLVVIATLQLTNIFKTQSTRNTDESLIMYSPRSSLILDRRGNNLTVFSRDSVNLDQLSSYTLSSHLTSIKEKKLSNLIYVRKKILIIDSASVILPSMKPDVVLLTQSSRVNLERLIDDLKPAEIVADASNYRSSISRWEETCRKKKIPFHSISEKGFYKIK